MLKLTLPLCLAMLFFAPTVLAQGEPPPPPPPVGEPVPPPPPPPAGAAPAPAPAAAQPPPPQYAYPPAPAEAPDTSAHRHDGFYLRFGLGFGGMTLERDASRQNTTGSQEFNGKSTIQGGGGASELSIGGTVGSGLVLCGTLLTQNVVDPELEPEDGDPIPLGGNLNFVLLGPGIHWYPDATGGFHFGATLGLAVAGAKTPDNSLFENLGGAGGGLSLAVGYDFWIADQWSLGGMLRFTGASLHGEATEGNIDAEEDDTLSAISLMFTGLYH